MSKGRKRGKNNKFVIPVAILSICLIIISVVLDKAGILDEEIKKASTVNSNETQSLTPNDSDIILTAHFIDVGQGDCSLFISGDEAMLIDCGESEYSDEVIAEIRSYGVTELDYIVATHAHSDHMGGMADIINTIHADNIIISEPSEKSSGTKTYEKFLDAVDASDSEIILAEPGYTFTLGEAKCEILAPFEVSETEENNNSVVMYITAGTKSFLMTGDAEKAIEKDIVAAYPSLHADILKLGHHGSKTSSCDDFLSLVRPKIAIISVGKNNNYNHPSESTIQALDEHDIEYYRTDKSGTITIDCTYDSYALSFER